jgi:hypothetical protein
VSRYERYSSRSLVYSKWHRLFLGHQEPMIDLDGVEYCPECSKALVLIETARDVGQPRKATTVLQRLAESSQVLALCLLYTLSEGVDDQRGCGCDPPRNVRDDCDHGITSFRVRKVWPRDKPAGLWRVMSPVELRDGLRIVRTNHLDAEHRTWEGTG